MIYNNHFGFVEDPFGVTPDPKFLFMSKAHEDALAHITYGIHQRRGFIMFTGEVGSGKTTLIRHVFDNLDPSVRTAMILNPRTDPHELLKFINQDFGLRVRGTTTLKSLMDDLNRFLLDCYRHGGNAVLAIDEAQELSAECLEFIRLLSNLETDTAKLLQVVLVGQPELRDIVGQHRLRQLNQRIAIRYHMGPLEESETAIYLNHRLRRAGSLALGFPERGANIIHKFSRGIPRLVNLAADRTLLNAFNDGAIAIKPRTVEKAIRELTQNDRESPSGLWIALIVAVLFVAIGVTIIGIRTILSL